MRLSNQINERAILIDLKYLKICHCVVTKYFSIVIQLFLFSKDIENMSLKCISLNCCKIERSHCSDSLQIVHFHLISVIPRRKSLFYNLDWYFWRFMLYWHVKNYLAKKTRGALEWVWVLPLLIVCLGNVNTISPWKIALLPWKELRIESKDFDPSKVRLSRKLFNAIFLNF